MIRSTCILLLAASASLGAQRPERPKVKPRPSVRVPLPPLPAEPLTPVVPHEPWHLLRELPHTPMAVEIPHMALLAEITPFPSFPAMPEMPVQPAMPEMPPMPTMPGMPPMPPMELQWSHGPELSFHSQLLSDKAPPAWAPDDPADSLYRRARDLLNRGEYRLAAGTFREVSQRYPNSQYAPSALYYQAFALYRIGGTPELREALGALETQRTKYPGARNESDVATLNTRILGVLAARGDAAAQQRLQQTAQPTQQRCENDEDQSVRVEALRSLYQQDPETVGPLIQQVLNRQDECSIQLRKHAIWIIGNRRDASATSVLANAARNDASLDVKAEAISWLGRLGDEAALEVLEDLLRSSNEERIQRAAIRALASHPNQRALQRVRALVERNDAPEKLRSEAIATFDRERVTAEETAWLRALYPRLSTVALKQRAVSVIARVGGAENEAWLQGILRNEDEPSEVRSTILSRLGQTMSIADLGRMYDGAASRMVREYIINVLARRTEPESTDKLLDVAKNGTDPSLRRSAINALTRKKDPRATRLLLEMISK